MVLPAVEMPFEAVLVSEGLRTSKFFCRKVCIVKLLFLILVAFIEAEFLDIMSRHIIEAHPAEMILTAAALHVIAPRILLDWYATTGAWLRVGCQVLRGPILRIKCCVPSLRCRASTRPV